MTYTFVQAYLHTLYDPTGICKECGEEIATQADQEIQNV